MSPETSMKPLNLIAFEHLANDCPVKQLTPDSASTSRENLMQAREQVGKITGAFVPANHHGAVLAAGEPEAIRELFLKVLAVPPHKVIVVALRKVEAEFGAIVADPSLLDGDDAEASERRRHLFILAGKVVPEIDFATSVEENAPTVSIFDLEEFLKNKAKTIEMSNA
jgi:hypothetical protein